MKQNYINAIFSLIGDGNAIDVVLSNLVSVLTKNGHLHLHAKILKGVEQKLEKAVSAETPEVTVTSVEAAKKMQLEIQEILRKMHAPKEHSVIIDPTLGGGFTVVFNNQFTDNSYKQILLSVYRSIVSYH